MPTPEDRTFFEGLNQDLAKSLNVAIAKGFKGASISLDAETVKLIGVEMGKQLKPITDDDKDSDGGGGGGSGSAGEAKSNSKVVAAAKMVFNAARQLVAQNASNILAYGDTMARSATATGNMQLLRSKSLTTQFGKYGHNARDMGVQLDSAMRANVRGLGKNTQNFMARTTGLGTGLGTTTKFLASNTNLLGRSMTATIGLGTDIQNAAMSNGLMADAMFEAVAAFEANTKKQQILFGDKTALGFQEVTAGAAALAPNADIGSLISKLSPTDTAGLLNLDRLGGMTQGGFSSRTIDDPARHSARAIMALAKVGQDIKGMTALAKAQTIEAKFGSLGFDIADIQKASVALEAAGGSEQGLVDAFSLKLPKPIKSDEALQKDITGNSVEAMNNMKGFAIELEALDTVQKGLMVTSDLLRDSFYGLNDATTALAKTMGLAAAGEAAAQTAEKMGLGGVVGAIGAGVMGLWGMFKAKGVVDKIRAPRTPSSPTPPGGTSPTPRPSPTPPGGVSTPGTPGAAPRHPLRLVPPGRVPLTPLPYSQWAPRAPLSPGIPKVPFKPFTGTVTSTPALGPRAVNASKAALDSALKSPLATKALDSSKAVLNSPGLKTTGKILGKLATPLAAVTSGFSEYSENEDKSRAAAAAVGAGGGAWGGATAGAAGGAALGGTIGAFFGGVGAIPGAAIGGFLGAIGGGIAGMFAGEKIATTVHDQFDPEFVRQQEGKKAAEEAAALKDDSKSTLSYRERALKQAEQRDEKLGAILDELVITNERTVNPDGSVSEVETISGRIPGYFERNNLPNPMEGGGALGVYNAAQAQRG